MSSNMTDASGLNTQIPAGSQADMPAQQGMPGGMQAGSLLTAFHTTYLVVFHGLFASAAPCRARCRNVLTTART